MRLFSLNILLVFCFFKASAQEAPAFDSVFYKKINGFQYVSYKPKKAKDGRDGGGFFPIHIFRQAKDGKPGKAGKNGPKLKIFITTDTIKNWFVLKVTVVNTGTNKTDTFYTNPAAGQLKIAADGGDGGDGGDGEHGLKQEGKKSATGGGDGGDGGKGGEGGFFELRMDSTAKRFFGCKCLLFSNEGGFGGIGGGGGTGAQGSDGFRNSDGSRGTDGPNGANGPVVYYLKE